MKLKIEKSKEWWDEEYSRPLFIHKINDVGTRASLKEFVGQFLAAKDIAASEEIVYATEKIILDLFVRHVITDGAGTIGVFTSDGKNTEVGSDQYQKLKITGKLIRKIVAPLEEEGLLVSKKGIPGHGSKLRATPLLIQILESLGLCIGKIVSRRIWPIMYQLKNEAGDVTERGRIEKGLAIPLGLKALNRHNALMAVTEVSVGDKYLLSFERQGKRIFSDENGIHGGRMWGPIWQNISGKARQHIKINGVGTVEIDISSTFPLIAYASNGYDLTEIIEMEGEPYYLERICQPDHRMTRKILKQSLLILFNAKDEISAIKALNKEIRDCDEQEMKEHFQYLKSQGFDAKWMVGELINKHRRIILFKGGWKWLFRVEGNICLRVIDHFTRKNVPILAIHDSFVVQERYEDELRQVLIDSIQDELGIEFRFKDRLCETKKIDPDYSVLDAEKSLSSCRLRKERYKRNQCIPVIY